MHGNDLKVRLKITVPMCLPELTFKLPIQFWLEIEKKKKHNYLFWAFFSNGKIPRVDTLTVFCRQKCPTGGAGSSTTLSSTTRCLYGNA